MRPPDISKPINFMPGQIEFCNAAHGMLWSRLMYQGTIVGPFRNALDRRPLLSDRDSPAEELDQSES
jgi:hypothetical protein